MAVRVTTTASGGKFSVFPLTDATAQTRSLAAQIARQLTPGAAALSLAFGAGVVQAATLTVNTVDDNTNANDGLCSLREAITVMNAGTATDNCPNTVPGDGFGTDDTILFDATLTSATITLNGTALPQITQALTITGPAAGDPTGITLDGNNASRILNIESTAPSDFIVELNALTLTGGQTTGFDEDGGAVRAVYADLNLNDSVVTGNSTEGSAADGGGLFVRGNVTLTNSTVSGNSTGSNFGAYLFTPSGGGLAVFSGDAILTNSTVSGNSAGSSGGLHANGDAILTNSTVSGNSAAGGGGGMVVGGTATLTNSTVSGNSTAGDDSASGGGLFFVGNATLENSTVSGNSAAGDFARGGAIFTFSSAVTITNSTISGNSTTGNFFADGGAIHTSSGAVTVHNSIVAQNTHNGANLDLRPGSGTLTVLHSLIGDNTGTDLVEAPVGMPDANGNLIGGPINGTIDPQLDALQNNGGPTETHALLENSPAIDAGDNALAVDPDGNPLEFDQRGDPFERIVDDIVDMGAYEFGAGPGLTVMFNEALEPPQIPEGAGTFTIEDAILLSGLSNVDVVVGLEVDAASEASSPADFSIPEQITIPANQNSVNLEFTVVDDDEVEDNELAAIKLVNPINATLGTPDSLATTIIDNDAVEPDICNPPSGPLSGPLHALAQALGPLLGSTLRTLAQQFCSQGL